MITIPGNFSIPGGIQIPTSQAITITGSQQQLPVSVASGQPAVQLANGDAKPAGAKDAKAPTSPAGQGWY